MGTPGYSKYVCGTVCAPPGYSKCVGSVPGYIYICYVGTVYRYPRVFQVLGQSVCSLGCSEYFETVCDSSWYVVLKMPSIRVPAGSGAGDC